MDRKFSPEILTMLLIITLVAGSLPLALAQERPGNEPTQDAVPPLYLAAKRGRLEALRDLIAEGSDVNAVNASGRSALMSAVYYRNRGIVRELLVEGADVNSVDGRGRTALMIAVANEHLDMVALLLAAGADVSTGDKSGNTAITYAGRLKNRELSRLLEDSVE